jgi:hypothetical protein
MVSLAKMPKISHDFFANATALNTSNLLKNITKSNI